MHSRLISTTPRHPKASQAGHRRAVACAAAAVLGPAAPAAPQQLLGHKYAVLALGRVQQLVEEGNWYCCNHEFLPQGQDKYSITFDRVVALKSDGTFRRGQPFLEGVTVEAEVLEEFVSTTASCRPQGSDVPKRQQVVSKFLVKKIRSSS